MQRRKVVLPDPEGPSRHDDLAAAHVEVDALEHLGAVEGLGDVDGVDEGLARRRSRWSVDSLISGQPRSR